MTAEKKGLQGLQGLKAIDRVKAPYPEEVLARARATTLPEWVKEAVVQAATRRADPPCLVGCGRVSEFFAMGNEARFGHVCRRCWEALEEPERARYAERKSQT